MNNRFDKPKTFLTEKERKIRREQKRKKRRRKMIIRTLICVTVLVLIFFGVVLVVNSVGKNKKNSSNKDKVKVASSGQVIENEPVIEEEVNKYPEVSEDFVDISGVENVKSLNVALLDVNENKVIAGKNADIRIYPASMTKVMTLLVAVENLDSLDATYTIPPELASELYVQEASVAGFAGNETVSAKDLLYGLILPSGADSAIGLANLISGSEEEFVKLMNAKCEELNLKDTHFVNTSGLHDENHYTTPTDMAIIMKAAMENETCKEILSTYQYKTAATEAHPEGLDLTSNLFSRMYGTEVPGVTIAGGKTGFTNEAGHCLVTYATSNDKAYVLVTSKAEGTYWDSITDAFYLYAKFAEGYTGEGVVLNSGTVVVEPDPNANESATDSNSEETTQQSAN